MRSIEEIKKNIYGVLNSDKDYKLLIATHLSLGLLEDKEIIIKILKEKFKEGTINLSLEMMALHWLLKIEDNEKEWIAFQEFYHFAHNGPADPDFRAEIFSNMIGVGKKILDLGVHSGTNANVYCKNNTLLGVDFENIIKKFKDKYEFNTIYHNITKPFEFSESEEFDVVVAGEIIEHLLNPNFVIDECYRVLKPNGLLLISCPYKKCGWEDPLHCNYIDFPFIENLLKDKFEILEIPEDYLEQGTIIVKARSLKKQ